MPAPSTRRISASAPSSSPSARRCSIRTRPGRRSMPQSPERRAHVLRLIAALLLALGLVAPPLPSFAQAAGQVRVNIVKAGLLLGGGAGRGVLTYRGKTYPF